MSAIQQATYLIPFRNSDYRRMRNLKVLMGWLASHFPDLRVLLIEQDEQPRTELFDHPNNQTMFLRWGGPFNKSWAVNCGLVACRSKFLVVGDADVIMPPEDFGLALKQLAWFEAVNPFDGAGIRYLSDEATEELALTGRWESLHGELPRDPAPFAGGIVMFQRDALLKIGGYPEEFLGWGGEDDVVSMKVSRFLYHVSKPGSAFHMYHGRHDLEDHDGFRENDDRAHHFHRMPREVLRRHCTESRQRIGDPNRYAMQ